MGRKLLGTHLSIQVHKKVKFSCRDNSPLGLKGLKCVCVSLSLSLRRFSKFFNYYLMCRCHLIIRLDFFFFNLRLKIGSKNCFIYKLFKIESIQSFLNFGILFLYNISYESFIRSKIYNVGEKSWLKFTQKFVF